MFIGLNKMPEKGTLVNVGGASVVFMDPSDPRIPYHTEYDGSTMHENRHAGYTQRYVTIISEAETAEAKKEDKRILKPYESLDLTDDFADEYNLPQKKGSGQMVIITMRVYRRQKPNLKRRIYYVLLTQTGILKKRPTRHGIMKYLTRRFYHGLVKDRN